MLRLTHTTNQEPVALHSAKHKSVYISQALYRCENGRDCVCILFYSFHCYSIIMKNEKNFAFFLLFICTSHYFLVHYVAIAFTSFYASNLHNFFSSFPFQSKYSADSLFTCDTVSSKHIHFEYIIDSFHISQDISLLKSIDVLENNRFILSISCTQS